MFFDLLESGIKVRLNRSLFNSVFDIRQYPIFYGTVYLRFLDYHGHVCAPSPSLQGNVNSGISPSYDNDLLTDIRPWFFIIMGKRSLSKEDRKSTRLNSSHVKISYAVFCLKKKILTHSDAKLTPPNHD